MTADDQVDWTGFEYRPLSGALLRYGSRVGTAHRSGSAPGYIRFKHAGRLWLAHRVAWFLHYGEWPATDIDHIDGDRSNNRLANLRLASRSQNMLNGGTGRANTSGYRGVMWDKTKQRWRAVSQGRHIGYFAEKEAAIAAYDAFIVRAHGEFARPHRR